MRHPLERRETFPRGSPGSATNIILAQLRDDHVPILHSVHSDVEDHEKEQSHAGLCLPGKRSCRRGGCCGGHLLMWINGKRRHRKPASRLFDNVFDEILTQ